MAKEIYNLGRVTGLSAYELAVRHQLSTYPDLPTMTEREWLAATVTSGASMILKIPKGTSAGIHDYPLPLNSTLCSGNNLIGYPFCGECKFDEGGWATKVTSYGPLISNTEDCHPETSELGQSTIPTSIKLDEDIDKLVENLKDFIKIVDGIIYQSGTWEPSGTRPHMKFNPNMNMGSTVRLYLKEEIKNDILVVFTGLVNRSVIAGVSKLETSSIDSPNPQNGDFIGPEVFPWANKILFTIPSTMMSLYKTEVTNISLDDDYDAFSANIEIGGHEISAIALEDTEGNVFKFTGSDGILASDLNDTVEGCAYITWKSLLHALANNMKIDVLGDRLRLFRSFLPDLHTERNLYVGEDGQIKGNLSIDKSLTVKENVKVEKKVTSKDVTITNNYITINGIRLYVASSAPQGTTDDPIPEGSLGIGW